MPQLKIPHAATMIEDPLCHSEDLVGQMVKNLPAMQETRVQSLGREIPWRMEWLPTPAFLHGKSHGQRGYSPWGHKESDMTQRLTQDPGAAKVIN